jgi:hypothetical protein
LNQEETMKRIPMLILIAILIALGGPVAAATLTIINPQAPAQASGRVDTLVNAQSVASTGTHSSNAYDQAYSQFMGLWYQCTSASSTPNVSISWYESPTTESTEFVAVGSGGEAPPIVAGVTDEVGHVISLQPPPMRYARVVLTGISGNPADTVCSVKIFSQGLGANP